MFASLPLDLVRSILEDHLHVDVFDLSPLDIAVCNHGMRRDFLFLLTQLTLPDNPRSSPIRYLGSYLLWIDKRNVLIHKISVYVHQFKNTVYQLPHQPALVSKVSHLSFHREYRKSRAKFPAFVSFLDCFPCLTMLDCSGWRAMKDQHLLEFSHLTRPLKVLNLTHCTEITAAAVCAVFASLCGDLKVLKCDVLDDDALTAMTCECRQLTTLALACRLMNSTTALQAVCANNARTLTSVSLMEVDDALSLPLAQVILSTCTALDTFALDVHSLFCNYRILPYFLKSSIKEFSSRIGKFHSSWEDGKQLLDVKYSARDFRDFVGFLKCPVRVRKLHLSHTADTAALHCLADRFGGQLEHLEFDVGGDVNDPEMYYVLSHCQNLTALEISDPYGKLSDVALLHLSQRNENRNCSYFGSVCQWIYCSLLGAF